MSLSHNRPPLHTLIAIPVAVIVLGAFVTAAMAVRENLRFIRATDQTLALVGAVRTVAANQKGFAQSPGEDIYGDLEHVGQIATAPDHPNPWRGETRAVTVAGNAMRIESDLPTHDCRRLALYFMARQPTELGLVSIEAQTFNATAWTAIYPLPAARHSDAAVSAACDGAANARLALIFRVR